jgi:hypothetical protein
MSIGETSRMSARERVEVRKVMAEDQQRRWPARKSAPSLDDYDQRDMGNDHDVSELRFED